MPYLSKYTGVNGDFNGSRRSSNSSVKKALEIAPDFYDAWNNLGGIYGGQGKYQTAYEHYMKAHECNPQKPNPVFGLMLTSQD
jgi:Tfp pilus assembly protein PilF